MAKGLLLRLAALVLVLSIPPAARGKFPQAEVLDDNSQPRLYHTSIENLMHKILSVDSNCLK